MVCRPVGLTGIQGEIMRSMLFAAFLWLAVPCIAEAAPKQPAELVGTHGYVHMSFSKGGAGALFVSPEGGGREVRIDAFAPVPPLANIQSIGGWLPPGRYRIARWGMLEWKDGPVFEVQPGRATDLGDFIGVNVGGYKMVLMPITDPDHQGALEAAVAPFASLLKNPTPLRLNQDSMSPAMQMGQPSSGLGLVADLLLAYDRKLNKPSTIQALVSEKSPAEFLRLIRTVTLPTQDEPARLDDGTLYFPADFGQLRKRTPEGQWSNVGMETVRQIFAVESDEDRLVAGSDDGVIRESRDGGASWSVLASVGSLRSVMDIDHESGVWVVTTAENDAAEPNTIRLRVLVAHRQDLSDLSLSREFVVDPKDRIGWLGARGQLSDGRYYIMAGNTPQRLDLASGQWKALTPRDKISSLRVNRSTGVLSALWSQGVFSKVYVSTDHGDSWSAIGRPPYVINDVQMDTATSGWASRWNADAFTGVWEMHAFSPAKNDWDKVGEAPFNCKPMRVDPELPVLCISNDASIFALRDGEWQVEFSAQ